MVRCSSSFSHEREVPTTVANDGDLRSAPRPNDIAQTSQLVGQALSPTEFENKLNEKTPAQLCQFLDNVI